MTTLHDTAPVENDNESVVAAVRRHHSQLARGLAGRVDAVLDAVDTLSPAVDAARTELARYSKEELLPHAAAEEDSLYRAGAGLPTSELLVAAMTAEHVSLRGLVDDVVEARSSARLAAAAGALRSLFEAHLAKENDSLLPALVAAGEDLGALVSDLHHLLGHEEDELVAKESRSESGCGCGSCDCA